MLFQCQAKSFRPFVDFDLIHNTFGLIDGGVLSTKSTQFFGDDFVYRSKCNQPIVYDSFKQLTKTAQQAKRAVAVVGARN